MYELLAARRRLSLRPSSREVHGTRKSFISASNEKVFSLFLFVPLSFHLWPLLFLLSPSLRPEKSFISINYEKVFFLSPPPLSPLLSLPFSLLPLFVPSALSLRFLPRKIYWTTQSFISAGNKRYSPSPSPSPLSPFPSPSPSPSLSLSLSLSSSFSSPPPPLHPLSAAFSPLVSPLTSKSA